MKRAHHCTLVFAILAASTPFLTACGGDDFREPPPAETSSTGTSGDGGSSTASNDAATSAESGTGGAPGTGGQAGAGGNGGDGGQTACVPGTKSECYDGPDGTLKMGACAAGFQICDQNGEPGECMDQVLPKAEDCSTPDDDNCDGQVNEGCACEPGAIADCYSGPAGTAGVGSCVSGKQTCSADGLGYGPCQGQVTPANETCGNNVDEDCSGLACSQAMWAKMAGDAGAERVGGTAIDAAGSVYVVGDFGGTIDLGGGPLISSGGSDAFVAKYDAAGNAVWTKKFGASDTQVASDVAVDSSGNVFVAGYFNVTIPLGTTTLTTPNSASYAAFVAKLDAATGNVVWASSLGLGTSSHSTNVAADKDGNVILACTAQYASKDIYVQKLSPTGAMLWTKAFGGSSDEYVEDVATDAAGNILLTGNFEGALKFGSSALTMNSAGSNDVFVAKLDAAGGFAWQKQYGDSSAQYGYSVAADASGNVVFSGSFAGTISLSTGNLTSTDTGDAFVIKLSSSGLPVWGKQFGATGGQAVYALALDTDANVLLTGYTFGSIDFGGGTLTNQGGADAFLVKLDPSGSHVWSKLFGDSALLQAGFAIASGPSKEIVIGGEAMGTTDFGTGPLTATGTGYDAFVAKFAP